MLSLLGLLMFGLLGLLMFGLLGLLLVGLVWLAAASDRTIRHIREAADWDAHFHQVGFVTSVLEG